MLMGLSNGVAGCTCNAVVCRVRFPPGPPFFRGNMKTFKEFVSESTKHPEGYTKLTKSQYDAHMKAHRPHGRIGSIYSHPTAGGVFKGAEHVGYDHDRKERSVQTYSHAAWGLKALLRYEPDMATGRKPRYYVKN